MSVPRPTPRLGRPLAALTAAALAVGGLAAGASAGKPASVTPAPPLQGVFQHVGTLDVQAANGSLVAEIVDATPDGNTLVYTDSPSQAIGFADISDAANPLGTGTLPVGGEPTSVVVRDALAFVAVNTGAGTDLEFRKPSGSLVVVDLASRTIVREIVLGGQPDSIALAPDGKRLAVVMENQRDEDVNDGLIPQRPTGGLKVVRLAGPPETWKVRNVDLSPVAASAYAGKDLEPEYVDINARNQAVVSFQENNHLAVVDLVSRKTVSHFPAGKVTLHDVDSTEEDLITLDTTLRKRREPDAVAWIDGDSFATANEGDYTDPRGEEGGSRGFTVFRTDGRIEYESAASFEHAVAAVGHYPEGRSENKGAEPESVEVGVYGGSVVLFVGSERGNVVGVYEVVDGTPVLRQLLPTGIGPEGLKAIPGRGLFAVSTETFVPEEDDPPFLPTMINLYALGEGPARYPFIQSGPDARGLPVTWTALSGMAGDPADPSTVYAVSDSALAAGFVYTIDVGTSPATITGKVQVQTDLPLDLEGVAVADDGTFWLASEGDDEDDPSAPVNLLVHMAPDGTVLETVALPADLTDGRRSNGFEGLAVSDGYVYAAIQRAWPGEGDTDEVNTKIARHELATGEWTFVHYPLEPEGNGDWIGLSELTLLPNGTFAVVERDKGWGPTTGFVAELKRLYGVDLAAADFRPYVDGAPDGGLVGIDKVLLRDALPDLAANSIFTTEKLEGVAVTADGRLYLVTDNDGVDDATGETLFLDLGDWAAALGRAG